MSECDKYIQLAKNLNMVDARLITSEDIVFDIRAVMKCRWGCEDYFNRTIKCSTRGTSVEECRDMIKAYRDIIILHAHNGHDLSKAVLEIERTAFFDGHYFAFGIRYCNLCQKCAVNEGLDCPTPERVRPCDQSFGIDVYQTAVIRGCPFKCFTMKMMSKIAMGSY